MGAPVKPWVVGAVLVAGALAAWRLWAAGRASRRRGLPVVGELWVYPIKGCRGISLTEARLTTYGIEMDRQWFVRKADGTLLTLRNAPRLALIQPAVDREAGLLRLRAEGIENHVAVPLERAPTLLTSPQEFEVWNIKGLCTDEGDAVATWLTGVLGVEARLCRTTGPREPKDDENMRCVIPDDGGLILAHDASPLMMMSTATAQQVADACGDATVDVRRFRPNIVFYGISASEEDRYRRLSINGVDIAVSRLCTRCSVPTVRPDGTCHPRFEPTKTLRKRWSAVTKPNSKSAKPVCGISAFHVGDRTACATLRVGDAVEVLMELDAQPKYVACADS